MSALRLSQISKTFPRPGRPPLQALRDISLELPPGSCTGLIGESGSGKSTLARIASLSLRPDTGTVKLDDQRVDHLAGNALRNIRPRIQMVFQDPLSALNPRHRVQRILSVPLRLHQRCPRRDIPARAGLILRQVGLDRSVLDRYPQSFSGGECQRIAIARALACEPQVLIADEPTAALDVATQAQLLNLLLELQRIHGLTILMVSHDLALVSNLCERIGVMDRGHLVELASTGQLMTQPSHPATRMLVELVRKQPPTTAMPISRL